MNGIVSSADSNGGTHWEGHSKDKRDGDVDNATHDCHRLRNSSRQQYLNNSMSDKICLPPQLHVLPTTPQRLGLHTLIRDRNTDQDAFVFYSERLMRPLCEAAMNLLPHMVMPKYLYICRYNLNMSLIELYEKLFASISL
ncbi:unnamed protein product [Trichobilharzia regenti]|nr:unnamed protein product [Trichobilharzia regenti]